MWVGGQSRGSFARSVALLALSAVVLENLSMLWSQATLEEQRDITRVMLKALQVDVEAERIVAIEPTPIFQLLFQEFCQGLGVAVV